jgi:hypothetical protein
LAPAAAKTPEAKACSPDGLNGCHSLRHWNQASKKRRRLKMVSVATGSVLWRLTVLPYPEFDFTSSDQRERKYVVLTDWQDIQYWCDYFDCTEGRLRKAVALVGVTVEEVEACLAEAIPLGFRAE